MILWLSSHKMSANTSRPGRGAVCCLAITDGAFLFSPRLLLPQLAAAHNGSQPQPLQIPIHIRPTHPSNLEESLPQTVWHDLAHLFCQLKPHQNDTLGEGEKRGGVRGSSCCYRVFLGWGGGHLQNVVVGWSVFLFFSVKKKKESQIQ